MDVINKFVGQQIYKYVQDNKIQMLGEPLASEKQTPIDLEKDAPYTFLFDIAVAPEFKVTLTGRDKVDHYTIKVDDALIDKQVDMFTSRMGSYEKAEEYQENDMLKGDLRELDEKGNTKEDGITVEGAILMPSYIKVDDQKKLFDGAKLGDVITFNPKKAYPDNDTEVSSLLKVEREKVKDLTADFSFQVTEIQRFNKHAVDQELFDQTFGKDAVKSEKEFREKIAEGLKEQLAADADFKFIQDVRAHCEKKVGKLAYPDELLKKIMLNNNKDKGAEFVEKNYENSIKELTWHLIKEQLVAANDIKIEDNDIKETAKEAARAQFAQYGMTNIPEEYIENYAEEILKKGNSTDALVDRSIDRKLTEILKNVVKLNEKEVTLDEFNKMME
jgi:trigger factor